MNHPIALTLSAIIIAAVSMIVTPVIANHSGIHGYTKTSSGSLLYSTKVTAEKVNFYDWRRSSSSTAYYSFNYAAGSTYLMAAMKNGYGYVYDWNVSPPSTKDWFLSPRSYNDVKFLLVTDQNFRSDHPNHEADAYSFTYTICCRTMVQGRAWYSIG